MNRGEEKALKRAANGLGIPSTETLLEFDIGDFLHLILPDNFPTPLPRKAKRIDLVASDAALYIHSMGIHRRYGWSEILECDFSDEFFHWRETNGNKCQIHMIRGFRPLAQVVTDRIDEYERHLDLVDSEGRATQRESYDAQDRQRKARNEILNKQNQHFRALEFHGRVTKSDGEILTSSTVCLLPSGIQFSFEATMRQLIIPYEAIEEITVDLTNLTCRGNVGASNYRTFAVQGGTEKAIEDWKSDLISLIAISATYGASRPP